MLNEVIPIESDRVVDPDRHETKTRQTVDNEVRTARTRVCHVSMCLLTGGLERLLVEFSRLHNRKRYELDFVSLSEVGRPADDIRRFGCQVTSVASESGGRLQLIFRLVRFFRQHRFDIVHTHNTFAHFYAALAAKLAGVPAIVNTQHGRGCGDSWKARTQFRIANRFTNRVVGVSEDAARLCRRDDRWSSRKITPIWNGIDLDRFTFHGPRDDTFTVISVARLSPEKDFATLFGAVALAKETIPDIQLRLVGDGQERKRLEALAVELGIGGNVEFLGERADVPDLLRDAGFFVSSSLTEGISLTLLEAMAVGLPVLTTSVGGNPEIVVDGETGYLVPPANSGSLAAAIVRMCQEREAWAAMGYLGRKRIEHCFDVRQMVGHYESLYEELLAKR